MEVRDPVHGLIQIDDSEIPIIEHPFFARLRNIKQLGFSEYAFPGATHTRFIHSIGVMEVSSRIFDHLFPSKHKDVLRLRETLRLACLLHDIGHAPLSHSTETVMPKLSTLKLPRQYQSQKDRQATHEDYTLKSITDSSFSDSFKDVEQKYGVNRFAIADLIVGQSYDQDYFVVDNQDYFPLLHQLVTSEMDCDRMDYLLRDSYFCGASYGKYDLEWIIDNLSPANIDGKLYLALNERAVSTFDDFLLSRFHMFMMIYFHYRAVCLEKMLYRYFAACPDEYAIPADIEEYRQHDDHFLLKILRNSDNYWAKRVIENNIPPKVLEIFGDEHLHKLENFEKMLKDSNIDYIKCSSKGRLSKYYNENAPENRYPIKVYTSNPWSSNSFKNIDEATDLYQKYSNYHSVIRIHIDNENLTPEINKELGKIRSN